MPIRPGFCLDHYEIVAPLGAGGMGEVYAARDTRLHREVALKVLPADLTQNADRLRRFELEAKATSALNHPNILTVYDFGLHESTPYLVAELLEGEPLRAVLQRGALPLSQALEYAQQIAQGLVAAHAKGIVHRDLKPENLFVTTNGFVKILDFGLAKLRRSEGEKERQREGETERRRDSGREEQDTLLLGEQGEAAGAPSLRPSISPSPPLTNPGTVMGTASYMSPEQARGQDVDTRSDIFSLGVVLYEMLTGEVPFAGVNALDVIGAILNQEPAPLANIPDELQRIVTQALQKDRTQRYASSQDLQSDLKTLQRQLEFDTETHRRNLGAHAARVPSVVSDLATRSVSVPQALAREPRALPGLRASLITLAALLVAGISYFAFFANNKPIDSLAILPFTNASGDPEMEYLSDGLTESLINNLAQLPRLRVLPRTMVFRFKGKTDEAQRIGKELGVRAVLTGRVQQRGDSLVIQTELIDVTGAGQLWGDRYDRKPSDLLATQREVTQAIAGGLRLKLSGPEQQQLTKKGAENNEAYQSYLKGRYYLYQYTEESDKKAVGYFNQAISLDPNYAQAFAGLASVYIDMSSGYLPASEAMPKAKQAVLKALALDGSLSDAHFALAKIHWFGDWDFPAAEQEFKRAIELNPNEPTAYGGYAAFLTRTLGPSDEATAMANRALQLDSLSLAVHYDVASTYFYAHQYDRVAEEANKMIELDHNSVLGHHWLGKAYLFKGQYEQAIVELQKSVDLQSGDFLDLLGYAYAVAGRKGEALRILADLQTLSERKNNSPCDIARVHVGLGEKESAFQWLEKAYTVRDDGLTRLKTDPLFDVLRSDPRFTDLMRRVGLPQ